MRLIDADCLESSGRFESMKNGDWEYVEVVYKDDIDDAPTIDAVPVVRCKDCIMTSGRDEYINKWWCIVHREFMNDNYYCADGDRRKDDEI